MDVLIITLDRKPAHIAAQTDAGAKFVDSWFARGMTVIDSGQITVPGPNVGPFITEAAHHKITTKVVAA